MKDRLSTTNLAINFFGGLQWLIYILANTIIIPVVIGQHLGLNAKETADFAQRTFFFSGLASLLQVLFGHRMPINEGPAGMWWGIFVTLATMAPALDKPLPLLRTDLELGLIIAGVLLVIIAGFKVTKKILPYFTPAVTAVS